MTADAADGATDDDVTDDELPAEGSVTTDLEASLPPRLWTGSSDDDGPRGDTDRLAPFDEAPQTLDRAVGPTDDPPPS